MKIALQHLGTKDLATLAKRTISTSKNAKYKMMENHPLLSELVEVSAQYDALYSKNYASGKGKEIAQADKARDKIFSKMKNFISAYQQMDVLPNHEKAKKLHEILLSFGTDLTKLSYSAESAQMKKLIEELSKTENQTLLAALSLETTFSELKNKQNHFETLFF